MSAQENKAAAAPSRASEAAAAAEPPPPDRPSVAASFEMDAVVSAMAFIFYNTTNNCWFSSADLTQTFKESFAVLTTALEKFDTLRFTTGGGELKVNGDAFEIKTQHVRTMVDHLCSLGANNFSFTPGLTHDEFLQLMELICRKPEDLASFADFTEAVLGLKCEHVISKKVVLREVSEEETVVSRRDLQAANEEEKRKIEADVLAILGAEEGKPDAEKTASLRAATEDSATMAGLIMQAVDRKQTDPNVKLDRRQVSEMVVECLDRAFDALLDDPFSKTQKGKKAIANALKHLEKELLLKLETGPSDDGSQTVTTAVERMTERLKMDSVVQDYSRKLKALEDSEQKILRFMKMQGLDRIRGNDFSEKLGEEGVDISQWHHLLAMSSQDGEEPEAARAVTQLAALLGRLEENAKAAASLAAPETAQKLAGDMRHVNEQVQVLTQQTHEKIATFVETVQADMAAAEAAEAEALKAGKPVRISRREMVRVLAEVVQELCQPLSVINCSLAMIQSKSLGEVTQPQDDMLKLAAESAARIQTLVGNLERVAGQPTTLKPQQDIQQALYQ